MMRIKVLHIITRLDRGGSAENTLLTSIGLNKNIYDVTLVSGLAFNPKEELKKEAKEKGVRFIVIPELVHWIDPLKDILAFWELFWMIKKEKFDIVHTHTSKAGISGRLAAKLAGVSIIVHTPHGHIFYGYCNFFLTKVFIVLERYMAKITDKIITLTEKGTEEHIKFKIAPREKFIVIPDGLRFNNSLAGAIDIKSKRQEPGIPQDCLLIGTAGRLVPVKGHKYLIEAVSHLVNQISNIILLVIGNGYLRKDLENQAKRLNISDKVKFLGFREDIPEILSTLNVFVLPSLNEGMGRVLVEAMALGIPVVATEVGGIPDVVINGKTGILVPPKNPNALAYAIQKLLKDKTLAERMGQRGKERAKLRFTEKMMIDKIERLYSALLINKGKSM